MTDPGDGENGEIMDGFNGTRADVPPPAARMRPGTVVVDSSEFFHHIPKRDTITDAPTLGVPWLFNNNGLVILCDEDAVARIAVPEAGTYRLFVRSHGAPGAAFSVQVGDALSAVTFGDAPLCWRSGGEFTLAASTVEIRLTGITPTPVLDAIVLTTDAGFTEADLPPLQYPDEVELLRDYAIPPAHAVKFGDVAGDGRMGFVVLTPNYSAHAFDHDGRELWHYEAPEEGTKLRAEFEAPGTVWDFDGDGCAEVVHWRMIEGQEWLVLADGRTGAIRHKTPWPTTPMPHVYNNFRTAVARLRPGAPNNLVVFTDSGGTMTISAYDAQLTPLWTHRLSLKKDHLGHYPYPVDINGDGIDEVIVGHLALDSSGRELWNRFDLFPDHHDHIDDFQFLDLDGDGEIEAVTAQSDIGAAVYKARTGELVWTRPAEHAQQITVGRFLADAPEPQIVITGRIYGNRRLGEPVISGVTLWFGPNGDLLCRWPENPLNGNPDFVRGDWRGNGIPELFWYKFHMDEAGRGTLSFSEPVYHMFDFLGNGAEQVVTLNNSRGILRVYGCRAAQSGAPHRDADYLRGTVANHTHY